MKGFIVYSTYRIHDNKPYVYLFGRLENGESFLTINEYRPYFFIRQKDLKLVQEKFNLEIEETTLKNKKGEQVVKIWANIPDEVPELQQNIERQGVKTYEADIPFVRRFLIDCNINSSLEIKGSFEAGHEIGRIYKEPQLMPANWIPKLKILSFDIETDKQSSTVYSIALKCENFRKVLIVSDKKLNGAITFKTEKEMLEFFRKKTIELDPDIIANHYIINFDLRVLRDRFDANKIPFFFGRIPGRVNLRVESGYGRESSANIPGRVVLDLHNLFKKEFKIKMPDYSLNTIAKEVLGEQKLLGGADRAEEIERLYREDPQKLVDYNMKDVDLVLGILEKKKLIEILVRMSLLTGIQPDRVKGKISCQDSIYLKKMRKRLKVAPSTGYYEKTRKNKGGYVMESIPGIYDCALVFDFRSMYPSTVWTIGVDPLSFVEDENTRVEENKHVVAPNGAIFKNENTINDEIVAEYLDMRRKAKEQKDEVAAEAIKVIMNSIFYGIFSNVMCRWFSLKYAEAITSSVKEFGDVVATEIERYCRQDLNLKKSLVFYRDTDSFMVYLGIKDMEEAKRVQGLIQEHINKFLDGYVKEKFRRQNHMYLDKKEMYLKFVMPKPRKKDKRQNGNEETGIKKKYCGYYVENGEGRIDFVGMEYVHTDATDLAKRFQHEVYSKFFKGLDYKKVAAQFVRDLRKGKYDGMLVYRKNMTKDESGYEKTTPPHVKAARLLMQKKGSLASNTIEYVMTVASSNGKKESIPEPAGFAENPIDYNHYVEKQLRPAVEQLFELTGDSFDEMIRDRRQKALAEY